MTTESRWTADQWNPDEAVDLGPLTQRQVGTILAALSKWRREAGSIEKINSAYANGDESFEPLDDSEIDALLGDISDARA